MGCNRNGLSANIKKYIVHVFRLIPPPPPPPQQVGLDEANSMYEFTWFLSVLRTHRYFTWDNIIKVYLESPTKFGAVYIFGKSNISAAYPVYVGKSLFK